VALPLDKDVVAPGVVEQDYRMRETLAHRAMLAARVVPGWKRRGVEMLALDDDAITSLRSASALAALSSHIRSTGHSVRPRIG
jgi:hypothetical protein